MSFLRPTRSVSGWLKLVFEPLLHNLKNTKFFPLLSQMLLFFKLLFVFLSLSFLSETIAPSTSIPPRRSILNIPPVVSNLVVVEMCNLNGESVCRSEFYKQSHVTYNVEKRQKFSLPV